MNKDDIELARKKYPLASLSIKSILILSALAGLVFILSIWSMFTVLID